LIGTPLYNYDYLALDTMEKVGHYLWRNEAVRNDIMIIPNTQF
jgi:hypothetical protein